jgi:hypothetical protein
MHVVVDLRLSARAALVSSVPPPPPLFYSCIIDYPTVHSVKTLAMKLFHSTVRRSVTSPGTPSDKTDDKTVLRQRPLLPSNPYDSTPPPPSTPCDEIGEEN